MHHFARVRNQMVLHARTGHITTTGIATVTKVNMYLNNQLRNLFNKMVVKFRQIQFQKTKTMMISILQRQPLEQLLQLFVVSFNNRSNSKSCISELV